jgi:histidyl-tRNA synthetase
VLAGGRYDGLIESLGGPATPAVGWAAGIERLAMMIDAPSSEAPTVVIAVEDDRALDAGYRALNALRRDNISAEIFATGSPRKRYDKAAKVPARILVAINHDGALGTANFRAAMEVDELERVKAIVGEALGRP